MIRIRSGCPPAWPVFGDMQALIRFPLALIAFERYLPRLYDLDDDPAERHDLASERAPLVSELSTALASQLAELPVPPGARPVPEGATSPADVRRGLEALGYLD
jgi:hypothetical protein